MWTGTLQGRREMLEVLGALPASPVAGARACAGQEPLASRGCNIY